MKVLKIVTCLIFLVGCSVAQPTVEISDHYDGSRFYNENTEVNGRRSLYDVLKWKLGEKEKEEEVVRTPDIATPHFPSTIDFRRGLCHIY